MIKTSSRLDVLQVTGSIPIRRTRRFAGLSRWGQTSRLDSQIDGPKIKTLKTKIGGMKLFTIQIPSNVWRRHFGGRFDDGRRRLDWRPGRRWRRGSMFFHDVQLERFHRRARLSASRAVHWGSPRFHRWRRRHTGRRIRWNRRFRFSRRRRGFVSRIRETVTIFAVFIQQFVAVIRHIRKFLG